LQALPRVLIAGFVKTDKEFKSRGETSRTTTTFVIVDCWTVIVASVGDSCCVIGAQGGVASSLTVDNKHEENIEELLVKVKLGDSASLVVLRSVPYDAGQVVYAFLGQFDTWTLESL